jgi:hypothetical protein
VSLGHQDAPANSSTGAAWGGGGRSGAKPAAQGQDGLGRGRSVIERAVRPDVVVLQPVPLDHDARFLQREEDLAVEWRLAQRAVEAHVVAVLQGDPNSMKSAFELTRGRPSRTVMVVNSGPLSERMCSGTPRSTKSSASNSSTCSERSTRQTQIARQEFPPFLRLVRAYVDFVRRSEAPIPHPGFLCGETCAAYSVCRKYHGLEAA